MELLECGKCTINGAMCIGCPVQDRQVEERINQYFMSDNIKSRQPVEKFSEHLNRCQPCPCCGAVKPVGWLPISTLPPIMRKALFWFAERNEAVIDFIEILSASDGNCVQAVHNYLHNYSHWMPLPEPPKESK